MRSFSSLKSEPVKIAFPKQCHSGHITAGRNGSLGSFALAVPLRPRPQAIPSPSRARARLSSKRLELLDAR